MTVVALGTSWTLPEPAVLAVFHSLEEVLADLQGCMTGEVTDHEQHATPLRCFILNRTSNDKSDDSQWMWEGETYFSRRASGQRPLATAARPNLPSFLTRETLQHYYGYWNMKEWCGQEAAGEKETSPQK